MQYSEVKEYLDQGYLLGQEYHHIDMILVFLTSPFVSATHKQIKMWQWNISIYFYFLNTSYSLFTITHWYSKQDKFNLNKISEIKISAQWKLFLTLFN